MEIRPIQVQGEAKPLFYYECQLCSHPKLVTNGDMESVCEHCGFKSKHNQRRSAKWTIALSLTALIFYIPANLFPFMTIELYGNRNSSTIWSGILALAEAKSYAIALIVFLASLLVPFLKLLMLFYLSLRPKSYRQQRFKMKLYKVVETIGRWSMLDIFLLAILVAIMKLSNWTAVEPGIGSVMFAVVVIFTMLAGATFDPRIVWERKFENEYTEKN